MAEVEEPVEILLVEDNPHDEELTLRTFKRHGISNRVHVVHDGEEAIEFLFCQGRYVQRSPRNVPNVILLDIKLPKVDGLEVLRRVKADGQLRRVPVVLLTSSREETDVLRGYDLGANSYIVKPIDFEQFTTTTHELGMYWMLLNKAPSL